MIKEEQAKQYLANYKPQRLAKGSFTKFSEPYRLLGEYLSNGMDYDQKRTFRNEFSVLKYPKNLWETKDGKVLA